MHSPTCFTIVALHALTVQARNNTLVHGWQPEPDGRGTWSILWSCLVTIFLCTWSILHLDVPKKRGRWHLLSIKIMWMLVAAMTPEYILCEAARNWLSARKVFKKLERLSIGRESTWTMTHLQFAYAKGFWTCPPGGTGSPCKLAALVTLIEDGEIEEPPIPEEELQSRGESDWIVKSVAISQIIWFLIQTLSRRLQDYPVTALEILTVALIFPSLLTYGFSWYKPQNVEYPVTIPLRNASQIEPTNLKEEEGSPIPVVIFGVFVLVFGLIHCWWAWNFPFPTPREILVWRVCSTTTTAVAATLAIMVCLEGWHIDKFRRRTELMWVLSGLYFLGRMEINISAFIALRSSPADAFKTPDWNVYIPHLATT